MENAFFVTAHNRSLIYYPQIICKLTCLAVLLCESEQTEKVFHLGNWESPTKILSNVFKRQLKYHSWIQATWWDNWDIISSERQNPPISTSKTSLQKNLSCSYSVFISSTHTMNLKFIRIWLVLTIFWCIHYFKHFFLYVATVHITVVTRQGAVSGLSSFENLSLSGRSASGLLLLSTDSHWHSKKEPGKW